jgi:DNA-binding transcriptional LysR family regulator
MGATDISKRMSKSSSGGGGRDGNGVTIKNLRTFFWLARHKNYHRVARQLNVSQPAISTRIAMLEDELGIQLLSRGNQAIQLTPEGTEVLRLSESILDGVDRLAARFSGARVPSGIIRIGVVDSVARTWLPTFLERMQNSYPDIDLEITTDSTVVLHSLVKSGSLHMSISISRCEDADINNDEIGRYEMAWVAAPKIFNAERVYGLDDLIKLPMIGYVPLSPPAIRLNRYFGEQYKDRITHNTTNSMSTMIWLAESGLGIAAIPPRAIKQYLADGRLAIVRTKQTFEPVPFILNHRTRPYSPVVDIVRSLIIAVAAESG